MIGIIAGPKTSFLDHLLLLCYSLHIPLYCQDPYVRLCAEIFYPDVELKKSIQEEDSFLYVEPSKLPQGGFSFKPQAKGRGICGFHGNSDKDRTAFWIEKYADEDVVLLYGNFFLDFMREKGVLPRIKKIIRTGNYRLQFYHTFRPFFQRFAPPKQGSKKRVLYAPTWTFEDKRSRYYSSVFDVFPFIADKIPTEFELVVKFHPYLFRLYPEKIEALKVQYADILFLDETPLIYPLLETVDLYLGDFSSVSYDFLAFDRPLFFLAPSTLGRVISRDELPVLYSIFEEKDGFKDVRRNAYTYAFGEEVVDLKERLLEAIA